MKPCTRSKIPTSPRSRSSSGAGRRRARKVWSALWPKLLAFAFFVGAWQVVVWTGWKPEYVLPSPFTVFDQFWQDKSTLWEATQTTLLRAVKGYSIALVLGTVVGLLVSRSKILRSGVGSMITGLQTMPSIAWFPASIVVFGLNESAILFVVVLGAAPSIANGLISGVDNIPPVLLRAGTGPRRPGLVVGAPRRHAGRAAVVRRRPEAGLGVRLAQPARRRADRAPRKAGVRAGAAGRRATSTTTR